MSNPQNVFLIGAGYVGHNVLDELLAAKYRVTVLVRRPNQASALEQAGARVIAGTLADLDLIKLQAAEHDITINTSSGDDLPSVEAILAGVRQRVQASRRTTFIHTGGAGVLEDGALGMYKSEKIYKNDNPADIEAIPLTSMHRKIDVSVVQAAHEFGDKAKIAIIIPPYIYGTTVAHKRFSFVLSSMAL